MASQTEVNCPICLEKLILPKKLPCSHTFCEPCIQSYVQVRKTTDEKEDTRFFKCPVCRMETNLANMSASEWIQILPTDHLVRSINLYTNDDSKTNVILCDPCLIANEQNVAKHHCSDCNECYCEQCLNYLHKRKKDNNLHAITSITNDTYRKPLDVDELCPIHVDKILEVFCFDHKKLCCVICLATGHRKCIVKTLDDIAKEEKECVDMEEFIINLSKAEQCTQTTLEESKEKLAELRGDKELLLQSISEVISDAKSHMDTLHGELKGSIEKTFSNAEQMQEFDIDCIVAFQKTLCHNKMLTEAVKERGSRKQKFLTTEKTRMSIEKDFEKLQLAFNYAESGKQYVLDIEDNLKNVKKWMKLATINSKQSDERALKNITETLCQLNCIPDCALFEYSFPVINVPFPQHSPPFGFLKRQTKWRLNFTKKEKMFGVFLKCLSVENPEWSDEVSAEICIVNQMTEKKDKIKTINHRFHKKESDWGHTSFMDWKSLISAENGYISEGMVKIKVKVW